MPEMSGIDLVKAIRQMYRESDIVNISQLPYICCCTAYTDPTFKKTALEAGMNQFITKPVTKEQLDDLLDKLV